MKVLTVLGARPQFIKAAVVSRVIREDISVTEVIVHTGQHYDRNMSDLFFDELDIPKPDYNLSVGSGGHGAQTGRMLEKLEEVVIEERPDWVLVYGDTNSTLAGALVAAKLHVPVAHVEAGLRSFNRRMPEEVNRVVADSLSNILFPPTETAERNLGAEGVPARKVKRVGDVMYDAALFYAERSKSRSQVLSTLSLEPESYVLATIHRAENTDVADRMSAIHKALCMLAADKTVVLPLHPRTQKVLGEARCKELEAAGVKLIEPVGYLDMVALERNCSLVLTDSGGVQKEAFFYARPCVTLRDETEWVELVDLGWNSLCPPNKAEDIVAAVESSMNGGGKAGYPYGDGHAGKKIVDILKEEQ